MAKFNIKIHTTYSRWLTMKIWTNDIDRKYTIPLGNARKFLFFLLKQCTFKFEEYSVSQNYGTPDIIFSAEAPDNIVKLILLLVSSNHVKIKKKELNTYMQMISNNESDRVYEELLAKVISANIE